MVITAAFPSWVIASAIHDHSLTCLISFYPVTIPHHEHHYPHDVGEEARVWRKNACLKLPGLEKTGVALNSDCLIAKLISKAQNFEKILTKLPWRNLTFSRTLKYFKNKSVRSWDDGYYAVATFLTLTNLYFLHIELECWQNHLEQELESVSHVDSYYLTKYYFYKAFGYMELFFLLLFSLM